MWQVLRPRVEAEALAVVLGLAVFITAGPHTAAPASLRGFAVVFPGHGPDRHPVEAGHRSWRQAGGVRLQPPSEGARAAEAARAGGGEEAASAAGAGEGPAGPATAR